MSFVIITKSEFENFLKDFTILNEPMSKEIIYQIPTKNPKLNIKIFSSIDVRTNDSREIGEDAIRCVLVDKYGKPVDKGKRTHRMENWRERLQEKLDVLQQEIEKIIFCKNCESVMILRESQYGKFFGCNRHPLCMMTMSLDGQFKNSFATKLSTTPVMEKTTVCCPRCNSPMRKINGTKGEFYGCTKFSSSGCKGTRQVYDVEIHGHGVQKQVEDVIEQEQQQQHIIARPIDIPNDDSNVELIETKQFPFLNFKFEKFNPVQSRVFQYYNQDINLVAAAATSAGKTSIAEMLMAYSIKQGKKAVFLSPLKAVSQEKYDDWTNENHDWSKLNVSIVTGDYQLTEKRVKELNEANVIIMTTEMMDSRSRRINTEKNDWLLQVGTVVMDESHLIMMKGRGDKCESAIMRFTKQNPSCRIVFLSATMSNVSELVQWLTSLNGKKTELINSNYRPITLDVHYKKYNDRGNYQIKESNKLIEAIKIVKEKYYNDEQVLVFVHTKKTGHILKRQLEEIGINSEFHYGDLDLNTRIKIETMARNKSLKVLIATNTLAWGINI